MFTPLTVCFVVSVWVGGSLCQPEPDTVYNTIAFYGATKFLEYTARLPELDTRLKDASESLTVFAPTNRAFDELPADVKNALDTDQTLLTSVINYHVVSGVPEFTDNALLTTLGGASARVNVYTTPSVITIAGSAFLLWDIPATNGQVVIVTKVMYPVPTGTALSLVNGDTFSMLLLALTRADASALLNVEGMTFLAPSDAAFQKLAPGVYADLLNNIPQLTTVLLNHMITGVWFSAGLQDGATLTSEADQSLVIGLSASTFTIGGATVTSRDVTVTNGVVHVIDTVLLPPALTVAAPAPSFRVV